MEVSWVLYTLVLPSTLLRVYFGQVLYGLFIPPEKV